MKNKIDLETSWMAHLSDEFNEPYMQYLTDFLFSEIEAGKKVLPEPALWFNALNSSPLDQIKVVILGQDPYPTEGHPHGLCFSVLPDVQPLPKSLVNINKELYSDLEIDNSHTGCLQPWANQGVLLLNALFTVEAKKTNAHFGRGWEQFSDKIIEIINEHCENVVFLLWGAYAQKKANIVDETRHLVLKTSHPSPLSAYRGFYGSKPFSKANEYLLAHGKNAIDWQL